MLKGIRHEAILRMVAFRDVFHEWPLLKAPMTPVLSPLIITLQSEKPCRTSHKIAISRATDSAQPMSLSSPSQPVRRCQAAHRLPTMRPMPHVEDASTHTSGSTE